MNALLEEAIKEAYASAPVDVVVLDSIEIWHRTFTSPVRVVRWPVEGPEPTEFQLLLESNAPRNAGETVTFIGCPFEITLPEKSQETPGEFQLAIAGAADIIEPYLESAAINGGVIEAIYRSYVKGRENEGPRDVWPGIHLHSPYVDQQGVVQMKGSVLNWLNKKFGTLITPGKYPALVGRG